MSGKLSKVYQLFDLERVIVTLETHSYTINNVSFGCRGQRKQTASLSHTNPN